MEKCRNEQLRKAEHMNSKNKSYEDLPEEWKEKRLRRMDCALTKIDETVNDLGIFRGMPMLMIAASRIEDPKEREAAISTLSYWMGFAIGRIIRIGQLVNEGMTVPEEVISDKT